MEIKLRQKISKPFVFVVIILFAIFLAASIIGCIYHLFPKLSEFTILEIEEEKDHLYLNVTPSYNAITYMVEAYDAQDNLLYEKTSATHTIDISDFFLTYEDLVTFKVFAKSEKNEVKEAINELKYTNTFASFDPTMDPYLKKDKDIIIRVLGRKKEESYHIDLYNKDSKILTANLSQDTLSIPYDKVKSYSGRITARLLNKENRTLSIFHFYLNTPIVGNIKITSPTNGFKTTWDDIPLYFTGGNNATDLMVKIYNEKNKVINSRQIPYQEEKIVIPATFFKENKKYKIEIIASYKDYTDIAKKDAIEVEISDKQKVDPVYVNKNFTFIKRGTEVSLLTNIEDATIYYTLDGSKPTQQSLVYENPIVIDKDMTIKTFATKKNNEDSDINTYDFKIREKDLVVYLSPSNQYLNKGVSSANYTNERDMMNKLTDYLEKDLKNAGVTVYRNKSSGDINTWLAQSNAKKSDFHFAIHSNASITHEAKGIEIYVDKSTSPCLSIASNIYNHLFEIYPYQDHIYNRGVKYAGGELGEANDQFIKCGALIEVAYHDNYDDALWMTQNMEKIARNIADSIIDFYQVN